MKKVVFLLVVLMMVGMLVACGNGGETPVAPEGPVAPESPVAPEAPADGDNGVEAPTAPEAPADDGNVLRFGYTVNCFNDTWVTYVMDAVLAWADEQPNIEVVLGNGDNDVTTQMAIVEDWITQGFDAILVKPVEVDATYAMMEMSQEAGIPFVAVQSYIVGADGFAGPDIFATGRAQMEAAIEAIGGSGRVAYMSGEPGVLISTLREDGSLSVVDENPNVELVANEIGLWMRHEGMRIMEDWIAAGIQMDAVVAANDEMAIGAVLALEAAGMRDDVIVAGIDATPEALRMMIDGRLDITMYADAIGLARVPLDIAVRLARGEAVEPIELYDILVLPHRAEEFLALWG